MILLDTLGSILFVLGIFSFFVCVQLDMMTVSSSASVLLGLMLGSGEYLIFTSRRILNFLVLLPVPISHSPHAVPSRGRYFLWLPAILGLCPALTYALALLRVYPS